MKTNLNLLQTRIYSELTFRLHLAAKPVGSSDPVPGRQSRCNQRLASAFPYLDPNPLFGPVNRKSVPTHQIQRNVAHGIAQN
jgi:hypothetical protein